MSKRPCRNDASWLPEWASSRRWATTWPATGTASSTAAPASAWSKASMPVPYPTRIAGEIRDFDITRWVSPKDAKKMDHFIHYGVAASLMAMADAGLEVTEANAERIGALIGSGIGGIWGIEETAIKLHEGGVRKVSPFYMPSTIINMLPGQISLLTGHQGSQFLRGLRLRHRQPFDRHGDAHDPVRRCRRDGRRRRRTRQLADLDGRLLRDEGDEHPQRRPDPRLPALGQGPRRLRPGRRRRHPDPGGIRTRQGPRRAHLLRAGRLRRVLAMPST